MSNSPLVVYTKISPNKTTGRNAPLSRFSIHCMAGNLSVELCGQVFQNTQKTPVDKRASSNYGIGSDGRIGMYVEEKDRSWCTSNADNDNRAVTIEVANCTGAPDWKVTDQAYKSLIDLMVDVCQRNGKKKVLWLGTKSKTLAYKPAADEMVLTVHRWFANKACPGNYLMSLQGKIADEVTSRLSTPTPAPAPAPTPSTDGATKFVTNLYVYALGRQPDAEGLNNWVNQLTSKKTGGANVAQGIVFSQECINRKLSDDAWVDMLYPAVLGRPADAAGKQNWVNQLKVGVSREQVFYNFVTSTEFANYCKSCGIEVGSIAAPKSSTTKPATSTPTVTPVSGPVATAGIKVGDTVRLSPSAKYYNGSEIPKWVKNMTWKVSSVVGNRAVLGRSTNGRYNINSAVSTAYLTKI